MNVNLILDENNYENQDSFENSHSLKIYYL